MKTAAGILGVIALPLLAMFVFSRSVISSKGGSHAPPRVVMEIKGMETALESYKAVHGRYPSDPAITERLAPNTTSDPAGYVASSEFLYRALSGEFDPDVKNPDHIDGKRYYVFKPEMLRRTLAGHMYVVDPEGNSYGYSTLKAAYPESPDGNNPTFDLWSTNGHSRAEGRSSWSKNW